MEYKVLAELVSDVIKTGRSELTREKQNKFYREFESEVSQEIQKMRNDKKRAYEEMKNIAIG